MSEQQRTVRNIIIFAALVIALGWAGFMIARSDGTEDSRQLGLLLFIIGPVVAMVLLRLLFGDGWKDLGLHPHFKGNLIWYLASILIYPVVVGLVILIGIIVGTTNFTGKSFGTFLAAVGTAFVGVLVKNIFEEFGWRGYLTPRLDSLNIRPLTNHLITGLIWGVWHIPYWLALVTPQEMSSITSKSLGLFIVTSIIGIIASSIIFGEIRLATGSVWPAWLLHNVNNAVIAAVITGGFLTVKPAADLWLTPGMDGILSIALIVIVGLADYRRRTKK